MGELEALGDVMAGGLAARTVEPDTGETADGHTHERACLNCEAPLAGPYCHECGQHAHVHRTLGAFFHDLLHGVFHFEGKIWLTLPMLAWRPGQLTRQYIDGQRASFVSPIALFLFSVFLMFAVISASGLVDPHFNSERNLAQAQKTTQAKLAQLERKRAASKDADDHRDLDADIREANNDLVIIKGLRDKGLTEASWTRADAGFSDADVSVPGGAWLNGAWRKAKANPDLLIYKLKSNSYKWSWALIPLSVPFLWLMFPLSRRFRMYDHVVFVTYSLCFMSLLLTIAVGLSAVGLSAVAGFLFFIPPFHMYRQLRGTYALSRWGALWRTTVLVIVAVAALITFIMLMFTLGAVD